MKKLTKKVGRGVRLIVIGPLIIVLYMYSQKGGENSDLISVWLVRFVVVRRHIQRYFSYKVTGQIPVSKFSHADGHSRHGQLGIFNVQSLPITGTGTSEDVSDLLANIGPTHGEGMPGVQPGSPDPHAVQVATSTVYVTAVGHFLCV